MDGNAAGPVARISLARHLKTPRPRPASSLATAALSVGIAIIAATAPMATRAEQAKAPPHTAADPVPRTDLSKYDPLELGRQTTIQRCGNCHALETGEKKFAAPLTNLFGRTSGTVEGYIYSPNMKRLAVVWSPETLDNWLAATTFDTPDIRMRHVGLPEMRTRQAVISYIKTLDGNQPQPPAGSETR